jgi:hypothetical protein
MTTDKDTDNQNKEQPIHSKFKFQIQIAWNTNEVVSGAKKIALRLWYGNRAMRRSLATGS